MSHSLKNFRDPLFLYRKITFGLFFFFRPFLAWFLFFFFSSEKFTFTHSLDWKTCFFFSGYRKKKKKRVFHSFTRFSPKNPKKQTIPGKKKIRYLWLQYLKSFYDSLVCPLENYKGVICNVTEVYVYRRS